MVSFSLDMIPEMQNVLAAYRDRSHVLFAATGSKIMVSAPHNVDQLRNGVVKPKEKETGIIAYALHKTLCIPAIIKTKNCGDDANNDESSEYRGDLSKYISENGIKYLIDLHQLRRGRSTMIDLGVNGYKNFKDKDMVDSMVSIFKKHGISNVEIDRPYAASGPNTVSRDIATRNGIDAVQIEINSKLLWSTSGNAATEIMDVVEALQEIIGVLNER